MKIHGIVCSYFGDGELDIGKTAAWLNNFVDTLFFYDMHYGDAARKYGIDYAKTFPDAQFAIHPISRPAFWVDAAVFRSDAFAAAKKAWNYADEDWVIFVDATESLAVNAAFDLLAPTTEGTLFDYLYDAVADATGDTIGFNVYVFLHQGTVTEKFMAADLDLAHAITAERAALEDELANGSPDMDRVVEIGARLVVLDQMEAFNNTVVYWTCQPHHLEDPSTRQVTRMLRVGAADSFDWSEMDDFASTAPEAADLSIVSYAYARYVEGVPDPADWTEEADIGFVNRKQMQTLPQRDLGLPEVYATADPVGVYATAPGDVLCPAYCFYTDQFDAGDGNLDFQEWTALWRVNPRDGVWYVNYTLGPVPLDPMTGEPSVVPEEWAGQQPSTTGPPGTGNA